MKVKIKLLDRILILNYLKVLTIISLFCSFILIAFQLPECPQIRLAAGLSIIFILLLIYLAMWIHANLITKVTLNINNSIVVVKTGDIFIEDGLKVIAFNEYFDTQVDDAIISSNSLNGIFINNKVEDKNSLDSYIKYNEHLKTKVLETNSRRKIGKKIKYEVGAICLYNDYLLTAFTRFDDNNRAFLYMNDYVDFLLNFWNEIDILYSGRSVVIPLLGSGITRFKEYNISEQELLNLLIWSFKVSRIKFTYPSKVVIVIHESKKDKVSFYHLKEV